MSSAVLDASALLAVIYREPGAERVTEVMARGAAISTVNLAEVVGKLSENGLLEAAIRAILDPLRLEIVDFGGALPYQTGYLRPPTQSLGLSLGDRACLALARQRGLPALTTERAWANLQLGVTVQVIR